MRTLTLLAFLVAALFPACTPHPPSIVGRWHPVEVDADFMRINHMDDSAFKKMKAEASIFFLEGGRYVGMNGNDTAERGTYAYDAQQKHLLTNPQNGKVMDFTVDEFSGDKLVLRSSDQGKMTLRRE